MTTSICQTADVAAYEPSESLRAAVENLEKAKDIAKGIVAEATQKLYDEIAIEVAKPTRPADLGRYLDYHPGHVRRIARDRGVAPHVDVEPPRRHASAQPDVEITQEDGTVITGQVKPKSGPDIGLTGAALERLVAKYGEEIASGIKAANPDARVAELSVAMPEGTILIHVEYTGDKHPDSH